MARRSRMSILKRQREVQKAEKSAKKRAKRLGQQIEGLTEPVPTFGAAELLREQRLPDEEDETSETQPIGDEPSADN
jgi:hypothetical protein